LDLPASLASSQPKVANAPRSIAKVNIDVF
jgi:hypothetical protein